MHQFGIAVPQSYERAAFLYQKAADQGLGDAYLNLGKLYYNGLGVKQDYVKAALLYQKAAAQKMPEACFELGRLHENPNAGYYHAPSKSMGWYKEAYLLGHPEGEENYRRLYQVVYTGVQKAAEDFEKDRKRRAQDALSKDYSRMTTAAIVTGVLIMLAMNEKEYYRVQQHQHTYDNTSQGYKECAQNAINHLIVECSAGLQIFDGSGNAVDGLDIDCNKGAWDCKGIIQNIGKVGYFYCEIANSRNLSDNRDEVIRNICESK